MPDIDYGYIRTLTGTSFEDALERVEAALKDEGFGVLTEIDVKATMKKKLDVDFDNYKILGACNPKLAYQALQAEEMIGLLLPCNVVVKEDDDGNAVVGILKPREMFGVVDVEGMDEVVEEADSRLQRALEAV
ncbi:MAG: DUF302 domain-containing protein [Myxococcota bacterium]